MVGVDTPEKILATRRNTEAKDKLAYLLGPPLQKPVETSGEEVDRLRVEVRRLEQLLAKQEGKKYLVLGIDGAVARCACCGSQDEVVTYRAFVEERALYCSTCWDRYERCGYWGPTLRVNTHLPRINADGLPEYTAEDCFIVPALVCAHDDFSLSEGLCDSLPEGKQFGDWHGARHHAVHLGGEDAMRFRDPSSNVPPAWLSTVAKLESSFGISAAAIRLNKYRGNADWKPLHHDRGQDEQGIPQMTVMVSLGVTRDLVLMHKQTGLTTSFPLRNGDVFVFTPETNMTFVHGISKVKDATPESDGVRLSFVIWGPRVDSNGEPLEKARPRRRNSRNDSQTTSSRAPDPWASGGSAYQLTKPSGSPAELATSAAEEAPNAADLFHTPRVEPQASASTPSANLQLSSASVAPLESCPSSDTPAGERRQTSGCASGVGRSCCLM